MAVRGSSLFLTAGGALLIWSGLKGKKWSSALRDVIAGNQPNPNQQDYMIPSPVNGGGSASGGGSPISPTSGGTPVKNKAIGKLLAAPYGWATGNQWDALVRLWDRESGWDNRARNPTSGAYGIPQALPPSKMPHSANPPISSAGAQISWGLSYIKSRYGSPVKAWAHETSAGWY